MTQDELTALMEAVAPVVREFVRQAVTEARREAMSREAGILDRLAILEARTVIRPTAGDDLAPRIVGVQ